MRYVRMLGLCLVAMLVASAISAGTVWASKDPFNVNTWHQYHNCPYENETNQNCFYGRTAGGSEGGFFQYGHVYVKLSQPVIIQGGFKGAGEHIEVEPPTNGAEPLESPELKVTGGLNVITKGDQESAQWPQALKESFNAAKKNKETAAFVKIEMAGNECFTVPGCLDTENLLFEEGTAFRLPLKVTVTSPWLAKLGGGPCTIGSDEHPIMQHLTTSGVGRAGEFEHNELFTNLELANSRLADLSWHIPQVSGASGCGSAEFEPFVDQALNIALEDGENAKTGITVLTGDLHVAATGAVREEAAKGNV